MLSACLLLSTLLGADAELPPPAHVDAGKLTGFQKTTWGMSLAEVKKIYPGGTRKEDKSSVTLWVDLTVATLDARVGFTFDTDKLVSVAVAFNEKQKGFANSEQVCAAVGHALREKYGETPLLAKQFSRWASDSTNLILSCMSIATIATYSDRRFEEGPGRKVKNDDL